MGAAALLVVGMMLLGAANAQFAAGDFDQEGSGIGSGNNGGCIPPSKSDFPKILQHNAVNEIRCHLACTEKVRMDR